MAVVQTMSGRPVRVPITLTVGGTVPLKVIPAQGERLPFAVITTETARAEVTQLQNRAGPNFATFALRGAQPGDTLLRITSANGIQTQPIAIRILARLALPDESTDAGLLARLLLAEAPVPNGTTISEQDVATAMTLMRVVLENRLAKPSGRWASNGVRSLADVVRRPNQFEGFGSYPTIATGQAGNIANMLRIANDPSDGRFTFMRAHVERAITAASGPRPRDPTQTGLYWWRTRNASAPGTGVVAYGTIAGNTFWREGP